MLLEEVRTLDDLKIINENRHTGTLVIRGTFQRANQENHNRRIYPRQLLENCIKRLDEKVKGRELVGELDHPAEPLVKLQNASHLITKLEWVGDDLIGEAEILPTPAGQIAKSLIHAGVKVGISSRGTGTLSESAGGAKTVNDDYNLITFDLVADPSTKGAFPSLAESRIIAENFVNKVIRPALSEKAFLVLLERKLNEGSMGLRRLNRKMSGEMKKNNTHEETPETFNKASYKSLSAEKRAEKNRGKIGLRAARNSIYGAFSKADQQQQLGTRKFRKLEKKGENPGRSIELSESKRILYPVILEGLEDRGEKNPPWKNMTRDEYKKEKSDVKRRLPTIRDFDKNPGKGALPSKKYKGSPDNAMRDPSKAIAPLSRKEINRSRGKPGRTGYVVKQNQKWFKNFVGDLAKKKKQN